MDHARRQALKADMITHIRKDNWLEFMLDLSKLKGIEWIEEQCRQLRHEQAVIEEGNDSGR